MYQQVYDPVGDSLGLTAIFAALPLLTLFVLLGGLKRKAHEAAIAALLVALVVAIAVYSMPFGQAVDGALLGAVFGLFPIMWIVWNALWIYNMTEATGHFAVLRRSFGRISDDQRVQAVIIAFCFGALLEALAGFGTPVAITAVMLIALGFKPIKAAVRRARGEHRTGRLRRDRDPDHHARRDHRPAQGGPRRDGRPPDAGARAVRPADPRRHGRRPARRPPGVAGRDRRRPRVRRRAVRDLELRLRRAHRHRRLAARHRRDRRPAAGLAAQLADPRRALRPRPGHRRRGGRRRRPRAGGAAQGRRPSRHAGRDLRRLRAVPDHHRGLLDRPDRAGQDVPRRASAPSSAGRASTSPTPTARPSPRRRTSSTGRAPRARCCSSAASSRCWSSASSPAARCASTARR